MNITFCSILGRLMHPCFGPTTLMASGEENDDNNCSEKAHQATATTTTKAPGSQDEKWIRVVLSYLIQLLETRNTKVKDEYW